ncbi:MAG TPA: hypothetical protein VEL28_16205 [Candidatus Binatia bacterium]|nr:hypothetical protein [Candidatus Binatia bacterium]
MDDSSAATRMERFLKPKAVSSRKLARDGHGRLLMAEESALDIDRIRDAGITVTDLGRRVRVYTSDMTKQIASYIIPVEVAQLSKEAARLSDGAKVQIGRLISEGGLYIRHNPGLREIGINDRGDVILRQDSETAEDATVGPVLNSHNTTQSTLTDRLVARIDKKTHDRDVKEARAWLEAMTVLSNEKTLRARFLSAGVQCEHRGNVAQLYRTTQANFFQLNDPVALELQTALEERFRLLEKPVPMVRVISVVGIPPNERAYKEFVAQLKSHKQNPMTLGLPSRLRDSQFFDGASKSIPPSCFFYACPLDEVGDAIYVITINTDYHGEIKSRGIHAGVSTVMARAEVLSAHASCAILNSSGAGTVIMGTSGAGKTQAATFWAERNCHWRREELERRYAIEHKNDRKKAKEILGTVGYMCQDDWVHIVPSGKSQWDAWPSERFFYVRSRGLLSRDLILAETEPILENATADYGAAGQRESLGRVTHEYPDERLFYDPDSDTFYADRDVHQISAVVMLEGDAEYDFAIRRLTPNQAMEFLMKGGGHDGSFQPFYNDYTDLSSLLISQGVVGDRLLSAYDQAKRGDVAALMNGDEALGRIVLDRLEAQADIWKFFLTDVPVFVVNGAHGRDFTQDVIWYASEHPTFLKNGKEKSAADMRELMRATYQVEYDETGTWTSVTDPTA